MKKLFLLFLLFLLLGCERSKVKPQIEPNKFEYDHLRYHPFIFYEASVKRHIYHYPHHFVPHHFRHHPLPPFQRHYRPRRVHNINPRVISPKFHYRKMPRIERGRIIRRKEKLIIKRGRRVKIRHRR